MSSYKLNVEGNGDCLAIMKSDNKKILTNINNKADKALHKALKQHIIVGTYLL